MNDQETKNQKTIPSIIASKRRASYILGVWVLIQHEEPGSGPQLQGVPV